MAGQTQSDKSRPGRAAVVLAQLLGLAVGLVTLGLATTGTPIATTPHGWFSGHVDTNPGGITPSLGLVRSDKPHNESVLCDVLLRSGSGVLLEVTCEGQEFDHVLDRITPDQGQFWALVALCVALVLTAGIMSGLTIGLVALDVTALTVLMNSGSPTEKRHAKAVLPLIRRRHLLLVTLLLANSLCMEALPLVIDRLASPLLAIVLSVTAVLFFGEIIPQALCSRYGLAIGANLVYLVWFTIGALFVIAWPISKLLDCLLGHSKGSFYRRSELTELVNLHGMSTDENEEPLTSEEVHVIRGALELSGKTVEDAMTPLGNVYMVSEDAILDQALLKEILQRGHSRIPVYRGHPGQFVGVLLMKALLDRPNQSILRVRDVPLRALIWVDATCPLYEMLRSFRVGQTHMAAVRRVTKDGMQVRGIITLEDVIEQLLQDEIQDENDVDKVRRDVESLEKPTAAEQALLDRRTSAQTVIDMAKGTVPHHTNPSGLGRFTAALSRPSSSVNMSSATSRWHPHQTASPSDEQFLLDDLDDDPLDY